MLALVPRLLTNPTVLRPAFLKLQSASIADVSGTLELSSRALCAPQGKASNLT